MERKVSPPYDGDATVSGGVIYTAITGAKDVLRDPEVVLPEIDYVCFSDDDLRSSVWRVVPLNRNDLDVVRRSRHPKLLPHMYLENYEWSLWVDANILIRDVTPLLDTRQSFAAFKHPRRACVYQEGEKCIALGKDDPEIIRRQLARYREDGLPARGGLAYGGVLFRRHHEPPVVDLMRDWWQELCRFSRRDQIGLPYVTWRRGFGPEYFYGGEKVLTDVEFLRRVRHARK